MYSCTLMHVLLMLFVSKIEMLYQWYFFKEEIEIAHLKPSLIVLSCLCLMWQINRENYQILLKIQTMRVNFLILIKWIERCVIDTLKCGKKGQSFSFQWYGSDKVYSSSESRNKSHRPWRLWATNLASFDFEFLVHIITTTLMLDMILAE